MECSRVVAPWLKNTHAGFSRDETTTNHLASTKLVYRYSETYFSFHCMMEEKYYPLTVAGTTPQSQNNSLRIHRSASDCRTTTYTPSVCFDCWTCWFAVAPMVIYCTVLKNYAVYAAGSNSSLTDKQHAHEEKQETFIVSSISILLQVTQTKTKGLQNKYLWLSEDL